MTSLLDRAVNLFTFLAKREEMSSAPTRDLKSYEAQGAVHWLSGLPAGIRDSKEGNESGHVLTISRPPSLPRPRVNEDVKAWLKGPLDDPATRPAVVVPLPERDPQPSQPVTSDPVSASEPPDAGAPGADGVPANVLAWLEDWDHWAADYKRNESRKKLYKEFFELYDRSTQESDSVELILGAGLLGWDVLSTDSRSQRRIERIRRHLLTVPLQASMDSTDGTIRIDVDEARLQVTAEVDMIPATEIADQSVVRELSEATRSFDGDLLDREAVTGLLRGFVHRFHAEGEWTSTDVPPTPGATPVVSWSPAVILRQRRRAGLAQALQSIADSIADKGEVPSGVATLLNPDQLPPVQRDPNPGAVLVLDEEVFSPLPLNDVQRKIIEHVDSHAQTLVQGPPGTGKTHTAAALISHLLAQGKRILITAETERALVEIRGKLPEQIKPLAVSVVGNNREEMAELRTAVDTIADKSTSHDRDGAHRRITALLIEVDRLRLERRALSASLIAAREVDVAVHQRGHYEGTLARIAERYHDESQLHGWIKEFVPESADVSCPLTPEEIRQLRDAMRAASLPPDLQGKQGRRPGMTALPSPEEFSVLVHNLTGAATGDDTEVEDPAVRTRAAALSAASVQALDSLLQSSLNVGEKLGPLSGSREGWVNDAVDDVLNGFVAPWHGRQTATAELLATLDAHLSHLDSTAVILSADPARLATLARRLLDGLGPSARLKTNADGSVKIGMFAPALVKECRELFEAARVDGLPPSTSDHLAAVVDDHQARILLEKLDELWRVESHASGPASLRERRDAHRGRAQLLERVLLLGAEAQEASAALRSRGGIPVRWNDPGDRRAHLDALHLARRKAAARDALRPLHGLENHAATLAQWKDAAAPVHELLHAVRDRDVNRYMDAHEQLTRLKAHGEAAEERDRLVSRVRLVSRRLADALQGPDPDGLWLRRTETLAEAFDWLAAGPWVAAQEAVDINHVQEQITHNDEQLRRAAEEIASLRAWNHAVSPDRLTPSSRADLRGYSQLVRKLGKGTGKYADRRRGQIRDAMERCRPSVPVWIMPLYRVTEQFSMEEQMFDVVIVDEASQAGAEAVFLQFLAPKIVVIGDDKQVTPSAVGTKLDDVQELAGRYLQDDPSRPYWEDPQRSLFDEALQRYGGQLTLTEHRRCVPEIIEFSNLIAYRPENVELVPVRQFGADRLEPFVVTHVPDGIEEGRSSHRINRAEARVLIDDLRACLEDPRYADRSMAVISLGGPAQVKVIESLMMEEIPAEKLARHEVRVGLPPSFQGSERDVVFLSLVTGIPGDNERIYAQTSEQYVQRFNVAVSRAKDQIRLFHTARLIDFTNNQDLRQRLLDYAYGVVRRGRELGPGESPFVSDTDRQAPFDSLFEQRVYNRIAARGYTVHPQFQAIGYSLDLVVIGSKSRVAVECDGDHWHGPEQYKDDVRRQRELERCGWTIFRVRESLYYVDPEKALEPLWGLLEEMKIRPSGWLEETTEVDEADDARPVPVSEGEPNDPADGLSPSDFAEITPSDENIQAAEAETADDPGPLPDERGEPQCLTEELPEGDNATDPSDHVTREDNFDLSSTTRSGGAQPFEEFTGSTIPVNEAALDDICEGILAILAVEGPALGDRVKRVYVESSGLRRMGHVMENALDSALRSLERRGLISADNPLQQRAVGAKTFRLPGQQIVVVRHAGPREIRVVPPREIARRMADIAEEKPALSREALLRATLESYGQKRLTEQIRSHLEAVYDLIGELRGA